MATDCPSSSSGGINMDYKEISPDKVTVSKLNERSTKEVDDEFVENIESVGVIQPPIVHEVDNDGSIDEYMGVEYAAVVGGRRL